MKNYHVFTHNDLDGAVSLLLFMWAHPDSIITSQSLSKNKIIGAAQIYFNSLINAPEVFFLDFNINADFLQFDKPFVNFIDHHDNDKSIVNSFQHAKVFNEKSSSNALFFYKTFSQFFVKLTNEQKKMVLYADDYDSGKNIHKESYDLNLILWSEYRNNFNGFINAYTNGFVSFTELQISKINAIKTYAEEESKKLKVFSGQLKIQNKDKNVYAACYNKIEYLVLDYIMKNKPHVDILILVDLHAKTVALRQQYSDDEIDLGAFAEKYCEGGGNNHSARGILTDIFMEITKKINIQES